MGDTWGFGSSTDSSCHLGSSTYTNGIALGGIRKVNNGEEPQDESAPREP